MKLVETDTGQMMLNKRKVEPCPVEGDYDLAPFQGLWEIFQVDAAYKHLCSIAGMYTDHSYLIIILGQSCGLDIQENGIIFEFIPGLDTAVPYLFLCCGTYFGQVDVTVGEHIE